MASSREREQIGRDVARVGRATRRGQASGVPGTRACGSLQPALQSRPGHWVRCPRCSCGGRSASSGGADPALARRRPGSRGSCRTGIARAAGRAAGRPSPPCDRRHRGVRTGRRRPPGCELPARQRPAAATGSEVGEGARMRSTIKNRSRAVRTVARRLPKPRSHRAAAEQTNEPHRAPCLLPSLVVLRSRGGRGACVLGGVYDVGASTQHTQPVLFAARDDHGPRGAQASRDYRGAAAAGRKPTGAGAACYRDLCVAVPWRPGRAAGRDGMSMQPLPGPLVDAARRWQLREIYWITRHGIRMSGMPAWGCASAKRNCGR